MKTARLSVKKYRMKNGSFRIRFNIGRQNWSKKDMESSDSLCFDFSPKLTKEERIEICKKWRHKKLLPEHELCYLGKE